MDEQDNIDPELNEDGSAEVEIPEEDIDTEELPDGSAIVTLPEDGPEVNPDFYSNMAESMSEWDLQPLASRYKDLLENDKNARELRDKQYEEGIRRTGMGNDAPGGATFMGASKVVHPAMAEGCVDFAARAIKEMFPPDGPVRTKIIGTVDDQKLEIAERKRDFLNWQITEQIEEFRDEQEQLLTQLPLGGSQYFKLWYDEKKKRPCVEFLPIDRVILPFAATNFYTAERAAEMHEITHWEFNRRVASGMYRDINITRATMEIDPTKPQKANDKIEGKKYEENDDGLRKVYHIYTYMELEDDKYSKGEMAPYILMIDDLSNQIVGLYRNWEETDKTMTKLDWIVEFKFIPWRGAYAIGLPQLIGGLSAALTGSLRALLDSAHINNASTMLKLKGARMSGQTQQVEVTQIAEIEGAPGVDDVRKIAMPMPFNPPSPVLMELLGWLTDAAKGVITTSEEKIADATNNMPVGTAQALIEQGAHVFSAIHARLHESQARVLKVLGRLNRWYLDDQRKGELVADLDIHNEDFKRNTDVIPVSDPHIFSETQRMAQTQAVMAIMTTNPDLFDRKAVIERFLKQMKVPQFNELMIQEPDDDMITSAKENFNILKGDPAKAYEEQDHLAHIQSHLDFYRNPVLGSNPLFQPKLLGPLIDHLQEHMGMWYEESMKTYADSGLKDNNVDYDNPRNTKRVDQSYAMASQAVFKDSEQIFQNVMPLIAQMKQQLDALKQAAQPQDPDAQILLQTSMAETNRRAAKDKAEIAMDQQRLQQEQQVETAKIQADLTKSNADNQLKVALDSTNNITKQQIESAKLSHDADILRHEQAKTALELQDRAQSYLGDRNV